MKFCLVSGKKGEDVKQYFIEAAKELFDTVMYAPIEKIRIDCENGKTKILFRNKDLSEFDVVFVRAFNDDFLFAEVLLDALENTDVYLPQSLDGYQITNHKFQSVERVARIGIPVPDSSLTVTPDSSFNISKKFGFPIVLKLLRGFGGKGVMLLKSESELRPVLDTLQVFNEFPSSQKFVDGRGMDTRALVIGDEIIGIQRKSEGSEWRANVSTGGAAKLVELSDDIKRMARKTASLLGLEICGVDFIETDTGPYFVEANFAPGIMAKYFDGRFAKKILAHIHKRALEKR